MKKEIIIAVIVILSVSIYFSKMINRATAIKKAGSIICFGDSIASGHGLKREDTFPYHLALLIGEEVYNTSYSGETTRQALRRIQRDVLDLSPRLVIVEFGGNDPYRNIPLEETINNTELMVEAIHKIGAKAVIMLGEWNMLEADYLNAFRELAKRKNVLLLEDEIRVTINDPKLNFDGVHPTAQGHKILADLIYQKIMPLL